MSLPMAGLRSDHGLINVSSIIFARTTPIWLTFFFKSYDFRMNFFSIARTLIALSSEVLNITMNHFNLVLFWYSVSNFIFQTYFSCFMFVQNRLGRNYAKRKAWVFLFFCFVISFPPIVSFFSLGQSLLPNHSYNLALFYHCLLATIEWYNNQFPFLIFLFDRCFRFV